MSHELAMLRGYKRMRKLSKVYAKEAQAKAVKSHMNLTAQGGTMGQIEEVCGILQQRDACLLFCQAVNDGLSIVDKVWRSLLVQVYVLRTPIDALAARYGVARSTVYRKLHRARKQFRLALTHLGFDEQWLENCYADYAVLS